MPYNSDNIITQNVTVDATPVPPAPAHTTIEAIRVRLPQDQFPGLTFEPRELAMLASPTACLNNWCINGWIPLLFTVIQPVHTSRFAILSTHKLPHIRHDVLDYDLWRATSCTEFWTKDLWIIPIHCPTPENHWILCVANFSRRKLCLFDSLAQQKPWESDIPVKLGVLHCLHEC